MKRASAGGDTGCHEIRKLEHAAATEENLWRMRVVSDAIVQRALAASSCDRSLPLGQMRQVNRLQRQALAYIDDGRAAAALEETQMQVVRRAMRLLTNVRPTCLCAHEPCTYTCSVWWPGRVRVRNFCAAPLETMRTILRHFLPMRPWLLLFGSIWGGLSNLQASMLNWKLRESSWPQLNASRIASMVGAALDRRPI